MNEIICPICGNSNPPESQFCENCKAPLNPDGLPDQSSENGSTNWLQRIRERSQADLPETPPLGEFGEAENRPFDQPITPGEIPDWLKEIQNSEPPEKVETTKEDIDWVARLHEIKEGSNQSLSQSTTFYSDEELAALAAAASKQEPSSPPLPEKFSDKPGNRFEASWQESIREPVEEPAVSEISDSRSEVNSIEELIQADQPFANGANSPEEETSHLVEEQPAQETFVEQPVDEPGSEMDVSSGDQIETQSPQQDEIRPESEIPSAGKKKSILSSFFKPDETSGDEIQIEEPLIPEGVLQPQPSRAVEYSGRLEISESQRDSINLLKKMLVGEIQPQEPDSGRKRNNNRLLRAALGVLLLVVMAYPFFTGFLLVKPQALFSPGVVTMHNTIINLPENANFLIVTDFEPAFSGEMKASAIGVIDNLMMKGMNFTVISTVPSGPALARNLLDSVRSGSLSYQPEKIAILGFIPGGTTGLRDFIRNPRQAAPLMDNGSYAWTYPAAQAVSSIQDYAGILVITENAETGRAWIEQLHGSLGDQPLLMVVSSQSAPIMRPYLDSGQLSGLIGGRVEGAMYDRIMDAPPRADIEMSSYQMGMLFAAGLILMGGLYGLLRKVFYRQPVGSTEEWHAG